MMPPRVRNLSKRDSFSADAPTVVSVAWILGLSLGFWLLGIPTSPGQTLPGEFDDIRLGRELVGRERFPSLAELRQAVRNPSIELVIVLRLHSGSDNHHLPIWSPDGQKLALQRTKVGSHSSRLVVFNELSMPEPRVLGGDSVGYDYMFRWGLNSDTSFVFVRLDESQQRSRILYSADGSGVVPLEGLGDDATLPTLYERTDGTHWLAYERKGVIHQAAWTEKDPRSRELSRGTAPRWSRDGKRFLFARDVSRRDKLAAYQPAERTLSTEVETTVSVPAGVVVRSPTYSPDERSAAWFESDAGERAWRIQTSALVDGSTGKTLATEVVVNPDFKSEGPSWQPDGKRIWYFSHARRKQQHYPFVATDIESQQTMTVAYPTTITNPLDLALNPATEIPEIALIAHQGVAQDLFVVFLNHY